MIWYFIISFNLKIKSIEQKKNLSMILLSAHKNSSRSFLVGENVVNRFHGKKSLFNEKSRGIIPLIFDHVSNHFKDFDSMKLEVKLSMIELEGHYGYDLLHNCRSESDYFYMN